MAAFTWAGAVRGWAGIGVVGLHAAGGEPDPPAGANACGSSQAAGALWLMPSSALSGRADLQQWDGADPFWVVAPIASFGIGHAVGGQGPPRGEIPDGVAS